MSIDMSNDSAANELNELCIIVLSALTQLRNRGILSEDEYNKHIKLKSNL